MVAKKYHIKINRSKMEKKLKNEIKTSIISISIILMIIAFTMWLIPVYNVWQKEKSGQAQLAEAEWSKQIAIREADARLESAKLDAQSEVEKAKGVAKANEIIGDSLKGNEEYLRYLYIDQLRTNQNREIIYVATEAGLPILEAGRR